MTGREIVEQAETGSNVEIDGGNEQPKHELAYPQGVGPIGDQGRDGGEADAPRQQPYDAARIGHGGTGQEPRRAHGGNRSAPEVDVAGDGARLAYVQIVGALQKGGRPIDQSPAPKGAQPAAHDDVKG